jgi:hypothetical protein
MIPITGITQNSSVASDATTIMTTELFFIAHTPFALYPGDTECTPMYTGPRLR